MKPDTRIRRWCGQCADWTVSVICGTCHNEICTNDPCPCGADENAPWRRVRLDGDDEG